MTRRTAATALLLAVLLGALPGCAGVAAWARARGRDLGDCARGSVSIGGGLYAEVQATSLVHGSVGFGDASLAPRRTLGWDPRALRPGRVHTASFPSMLVAWPWVRRDLIELGHGDSRPGVRGFVSPWILMGSDHIEGRSHSLLGLHRFLPPNPLLPEPAPETAAERWSRRSWLAASGTLLVVRVDAGFNPLEFLDFLAGLAGWDPLGDDDRGSEPGTEPGAGTEAGTGAAPGR